MKIIGLGGTNGSGKDVLGQILAEHYNFLFVSVADLLREEAKERGLEPSRENLRSISAQWRRQKGLGVLVDMAYEKFQKTGGKYSGLVVGSLRNSGEAERLHKLGGKLVWVDADPKIRYERVAGRGRDAESKMTFEQFLANEQSEMKLSGDHATLNMTAVKAAADINLINDSTLEAFRQKIAQALGLGG